VNPTFMNGSAAPDFKLSDLEGHSWELADFHATLLVIFFWSAECAWSQRCDPAALLLQQEFGNKVNWVAMASNADETITQLKQAAKQRQLPLVLVDKDQQMADHFEAVTTPQYFVFDQERRLRYQGAFDDANFRQRSATKPYLADAIRALLNGEKPEPEQTTSYGCAIVRWQIS
jgi:peroxiredoxin